MTAGIPKEDTDDASPKSTSGYCNTCAQSARGVFCSRCGARLAAAPTPAPLPEVLAERFTEDGTCRVCGRTFHADLHAAHFRSCSVSDEARPQEQGSQYTADGTCRGCNKAVEAGARTIHPRYCVGGSSAATATAQPHRGAGSEHLSASTVQAPTLGPRQLSPGSIAAASAPSAAWYPDPHQGWQLRYWDGTTWTSRTAPASEAGAPGMTSAGHAPLPQDQSASQQQTLVRRLTEYTRWSGVGWIVLGALQVLSLWGIVAGAWNIYAGYTRIRAAKDIERRDPGVPDSVQGLGGYIIIGLINLFLGGVVGIVLVGVDLFVRDQILKNANMFAPANLGQPSAAQPATPPAFAP